jgi:anaerobic selenocysteine-containing dehydrogenase
MAVHISETHVVRGACPQDCPDTCAFLYHVEDGKLVEVAGDPDHPMTRGGLCVKLKNFAEHHYNAERLLYPIKRVGPKGVGKFERISWDRALSARGRVAPRRRWHGRDVNMGVSPQARLHLSIRLDKARHEGY